MSTRKRPPQHEAPLGLRWGRRGLLVVCVALLSRYAWLHSENFARVLSGIRPELLVLMGLLAVVSNLVAGGRIALLLREQNAKLGWRDGIRLWSVGRLMGTLAPQGGNVYRALAFRDLGLRLTDYVVFVTALSWLTVATFLCLGLATLLLAPTPIRVVGVDGRLLLAAGVLLFALPLLFARRLRKRASRGRGGRVTEKIAEIAHAALSIVSNRPLLLRFVASGIVSFALTLAVFRVGFASFGLRVEPQGLALLAVLLRLSGLVNLTPGNLGIVEPLTGVVSVSAGLTLADGILVMLGVRIVSLLAVTVLAVVFGRRPRAEGSTSRLRLLANSIRREGPTAAALRVLKAVSKGVAKFFDHLPFFLVGLVRTRIVRSVNGYELALYTGDKGISRELYTYGKREHLSTNLILEGKVIRPGDTVLDIGANIGYYALMEARVVGEAGKVYAVEPSPRNYRVLLENIELNRFGNIETHNVAMGDRSGRASMLISDRSNWSRLVDREIDDRIDGTVDVPMTTVDEFMAGRDSIDLIRMDVEGYEFKIFQGMRETLRTPGLKLFVELHPMFLAESESLEIFDLLEVNGFGVEHCILNPSLIRNPVTRFAYSRLGEQGDYDGALLDMTLSEARDWVRTHDFKRLPHFLFSK